MTNTAPQIELFDALGATPPVFAHYPLFVAPSGEKLSKRSGSLSLRALRQGGIEPLALASYLAKIGTSDAIEPRTSLAQLADEFAFDKIGRALATFDPHELETLNAKLLHLLPYDAVAPRLGALLPPPRGEVVAEGDGWGERFWDAVKPNLTKLADARDWHRIITGPVTPVIEDAALCAKAAELLPREPWDDTTWSSWTKAISAAAGAKGRALFHPLRLALTARDHGPEMKKLLPLIGRERAAARLGGQTA